MVIKELEEKPTKIPKSYRIQGSDETRRISATGGDLGRRTASSGWRQMEQKREARRLDKTPQNRTTSRLEDGLPVGDSRWRWTTDTSVGAGVRRVGGAAASLRNGGGRNSKGREGGWNSKEKRWEWRETGSFHTSLSLSLSLMPLLSVWNENHEFFFFFFFKNNFKLNIKKIIKIKILKF